MSKSIKTIKSYCKGLKAQGLTQVEIAKVLEVSQSMVSDYLNKDFNCKLETAILIYKLEGVVIHPFSEESLNYEINRES